jgi:hypothetical protein
MEFNEALREILEGIQPGFVFDSHFVINQLIKNYSDEYINFVANFAGGEQPTLTAHQRIGHEILRFDGDLVNRQSGDSWSETIHGRGGSCALWRRI